MKTIIYIPFLFLFCHFSNAQNITPFFTVGHTASITSIKRVPGTGKILTSSRDGKIKIWDENLSFSIQTFEDHNNPIMYMVPSIDGKHILSADIDGNAFLWNIETLETEKGIFTNKRITTMDLSNDNSKCVVADATERVILYDINEQKEITTIQDATFGGLVMEKVRYIWVKFSSDQKFVFYTSKNKLIQYNIQTKESKKLKSPDGDFMILENSPDGNYLYAGTEKGVVVKIETSSFQIVATLPKLSNAIASICFNNAKTEMLVGCVDSWFYTFNLTSLNQLSKFENTGGGTLSACYSKNDNSIYCFGSENFFQLQANNGKIINTVSTQKQSYIRDIRFNNTNGDMYILIGSNYYKFGLSNLSVSKLKLIEKEIPNNILASPDRTSYVVKVPGKDRKHILYPNSTTLPPNDDWMFASFFEVGNNKSEDTREIFRRFENKLGCWHFKPLCFSPDNSTLIAGKDAKLYIYSIDRYNIKIIDSVNLASSSSAIFAKFNPTSKNLAVLTSKGHVFLFDLTLHNPTSVNGTIYGSLNYTKKFETDFEKPSAICLANDNSKLVIYDSKYGLSLLSTADGKVMANAKTDGFRPSKIYFTPDNKQIALIMPSGKIMFYEANSLKLNFEILFMNEDDWVISTPENYYFASKNANSKIKFKMGNELYPVEQFELKFNRPDIVLAKTGFASNKSIDIYKTQYQKRLKSIGFTENDIILPKQLPKCVLKTEIPALVNTNSIDLNFYLSDSSLLLKKLFIVVNGMSLYGSNGMDLFVNKSKTIEQNVKIPLLNGTNIVSYYVINASGVASLRKEVKIKCETKEKRKLFIISVGVSEYKNKAFNLNYAAKDAKDIIASMTKLNLYDTIIAKSLLNSEVTRKNFLKLKEFSSQIGSNDVVLFFIAGHGILDKNLNYYFGSSDIDFNNPALLGISFKDIEDVLSAIKSYQKFLIMDTCHSGEIDKDVVSASEEKVESNKNVTFRNAGNVTAKNKTGLSETDLNLLTADMFSDLRVSTGASILASASGTELAMESDKWKNGLFTYCLLNGLQTKGADLDHNGIIMLSELRKYLSEEVEIISGGKQKPATRAFNKDGDFRVW